jgi:hypothetical protein
VAGLGITGSFQAEPLESVVEAVCAVTGIRCEVTPDGVVIGTRGR